jgi:hypothetical protein
LAAAANILATAVKVAAHRLRLATLLIARLTPSLSRTAK